MNNQNAAASGRRLKNPSAKKDHKNLVMLTMVAPGAIWYFLLRYLPMAGIVIAFQNYKIYTEPGNKNFRPSFLQNIIHSEWVGFKNFRFLFLTPDAPLMFRNTILYNAVFIALGLVISVAFAVMLSEMTNKFMPKAYQTMMFFPYFISWVVVSYFVFAFIDPNHGLLTSAQKAAGEVPTMWYSVDKPWPYILTISNVWKNTGYSTMLYLSAIAGIDTTLYEAAAIDGASKWQQIKHVTLPHLRTMISILLIMNVGKIFNADFGLFYSVPMNSGLLRNATQVIDTYVYTAFMTTGNVPMSSAAGLLQNVLGFVLIVAANFIVKKIDEESSLF